MHCLISPQKMNNTFIPQAVEIVTQAIDADKIGEYETALKLYRRLLLTVSFDNVKEISS